MANIQKQFEQFDEAIRLKRFDENQTLREKRDIILDRLRDRFAAMRKEGETIPTFEPLNQGSYQMGTGIHPAEGDYDIDVGLRFNCSKEEYLNPVTLKELVADALEDHTKIGAEVRRSCVTVYYMVDGKQEYHVDLAIYTYDSTLTNLYLAKGKRGSGVKDRWWEESDPKGLATWVEQRFADKEAQTQFLRVIRALKRWKTEKFKTDGNNAPSGIGLTVAAGQWFQPQVTRAAFTQKTTFDDLKAMRLFVETMYARFKQVDRKDGSPLYRLEVPLPVRPYKDIFEKMTTGQMTTFRERLQQLQTCLEEVNREADPVVACQQMRKYFGEEFPVPDKKDTGQSGPRVLSSSGISA